LAKQAIKGGASGIVCHLREDRRHIKDKDVFRLKQTGFRIDLEMAATNEMLKIALKVKPYMVTLVPEKRQEVTTEGGLNVVKDFARISSVAKILEKKGIRVSLFVDPDEKQINKAAISGATYIEIHTGAYANASTDKTCKRELAKIIKAVKWARALDLRVNAGHGLDCKNIKPLIKVADIEEFNIGFSLIAKSVEIGLRSSVRLMRNIIDG
jgi:pyridoxine 5-phosphate synthase